MRVLGVRRFYRWRLVAVGPRASLTTAGAQCKRFGVKSAVGGLCLLGASKTLVLFFEVGAVVRPRGFQLGERVVRLCPPS